MDFSIPEQYKDEVMRLSEFLRNNVKPQLNAWIESGVIPDSFFRDMGENNWLGFTRANGQWTEQSVLLQSLLMEEIAKLSPGLAIAVLVQISLGLKGLHLFGTTDQKKQLLGSSASGTMLLCVGNTENLAGSDVAGISTSAEKVTDGWLLTGAKAFVTNGNIADFCLVTAVTDPDAGRTRRLSLFLVDLSSPGISRHKLNKGVWYPSDLTRIQLEKVRVPDENLMGTRGKGLSHILEIFMNSRITISALALGTAVGAFNMGIERAKKRRVFGSRVIDFQAKSFEAADLYSKIEAARLMLYRACWLKDQGIRDVKLEASMAKYLSVEIAKQTSMWAADLFGAVSIVADHPVHKFPLDAWAVALGEGTQDVQKLVISREILNEQVRE
ncbi:MAG: acyl-CoA dehydrogenase family protein [Candidatus Zhuqueibacterota bacterium]